MRTILRMLPVVIGLVSATGCSKSFLELAPISNANAEVFYKTQDDFDLAAVAAYNSLYTIYGPEGAASYTGELMGDNATIYNISGIEVDKWQFRDYSFKTTNTVDYTFWQDYYKAIFNINTVLTKIETAALSDSYKTGIKAQMMFLRGLYYFNMVRTWGEVPLITKPVSAAESYAILRSSVDDIYTQIIADLKYSVTNLPLETAITVKGKASKGAAGTLLGKVYLTKGDKTSATQVLTEVYTSNQYQLLPSYATLWLPASKNTKESIFEIQYIGGSISGPYSKYYQTFFPNGILGSVIGGGMNQVTDDLYNEYETGDARRDITISLGYTNGSFINQKYTKKWTDASAAVSGGNIVSSNDFMVLRYADLLLLLSEATGDAKYLNEVRARVSLPLFGTGGYPSVKYPTLDLAIEHERRVELAMEYHRFFDLKRTNRAVTVLTAKGKPVTTDKLVIPVPEIVRTQNPAITQNKAYQ